MLRLFLGRTLGPAACRALVQEAGATAHEQLSSYQAIRAELVAEDEHAGHRPYWLLTVSAGEHTARAAIAWAEEALAALDDLCATVGSADSDVRAGRRRRRRSRRTAP